ncbi:MAG: alkaline phosphatase D family protein [Streptosporangiaceae bacterium]
MADASQGDPLLVLGPLLRYVGETAATIWVETDRACTVGILGHEVRTFEVAGHHYGLVVAGGLQPGAEYEYQVILDGTVRWPAADSAFPPSVVRTLDPDGPLRLVFGSCRIAEMPALKRRPGRAGHGQEHGADALSACALSLRETPRERWPDAMLLIGDQVYADEVGPATREFIGGRRDLTQPPGDQVADFTEYCFLYREAWSEPAVRWLLSVVPTAMIFDDHDVHDDWNISAAWRREFQAQPWWRSRITGAFMSYWIYQHLGNLSPEDLGKDELWRLVHETDDAAAVLSDFAVRADQGAEGIQWSFRRTFGRVRVVVIDSRAGRVVEDGRRLMVNEAEWQWVNESVSGDWDHVVLATSVPLLLSSGLHALEAWNEAVCGGAWGKYAARAGERMRQAADLEHWAAFGKSFAKFGRLLTRLATGGAAGAPGEPPASITVISGDVHHSYLAAVDFPAGTHPRSAVYQAVCSPIHNLLPDQFRRGQRLATSRAGELIGTTLARLAGARKPGIRWRITHGPWFCNMLSVLEFDGRQARIRFERTTPDVGGTARLRPVCETELS